MLELDSVHVYRCGTCGRGFEDEEGIRAHQDEYRGQENEHDGEPWSGETVRIGNTYVWEPKSAHARSNIRVTRIADNGDTVDRYWIFSEGDNPPGTYPNSLGRFAEAVWPGEYVTEES